MFRTDVLASVAGQEQTVIRRLIIVPLAIHV